MRNNLSDLKSFLDEGPKHIVITTHHKPDADALGSSLGWCLYLRQKGHQVQVISPTDYPKFLHWMEGQEEVLQYTRNLDQSVIRQHIQDADLICCLDFSRLDRINELGPLVAASSAKKLLVDHHLDPEDFAEYWYWYPQSAATCELIFEIIEHWSDQSLITPALGECLYAGIMTDTGSFRHNNTTANVHEIVAKLIRLGVSSFRVHKYIYDTASLGRLKMLGYVLSEKMVILPEYKTGYITLNQDELSKFHAETGDTEGFVNWILSVDGINFAFLLVDRVVMRKMSFRSVGSFAVNEFAAEHFNGGGHHNAAGGKSDESLVICLDKFLTLLPAYQEKIIHSMETPFLQN
jgi:bifunctional oligoribonuclease and PAP phosphatase NrnA